jgi:hypothetical protein
MAAALLVCLNTSRHVADHQTAQVLRIPEGILNRQHAAPRLAMEHKVLQAQAAPHLFHLFGVTFGCP